MKKSVMYFMFYLLACTAVTTVSSCREDKSTKEKIEDSVDEVGDDIEEGAEDVEDAIEDATDDN